MRQEVAMQKQKLAILSMASIILLASSSIPSVQAQTDSALPSIPRGYSLPGDDFSPVYPNPFNPTAKIDFSIKQDGKVKVSVFNILGKEVAVLTNKDYVAGKYTLSWTAAENTPSGIYICRIVAGKFIATRKMVLAR